MKCFAESKKWWAVALALCSSAAASTHSIYPSFSIGIGEQAANSLMHHFLISDRNEFSVGGYSFSNEEYVASFAKLLELQVTATDFYNSLNGTISRWNGTFIHERLIRVDAENGYLDLTIKFSIEFQDSFGNRLAKDASYKKRIDQPGS